MERLTYVDARGRVLFTPSEEVDENPDIGYDIRQIAEYGYREYLSLIAERLANREQYCEMLKDELKTYKDAEEQGLLLRLPAPLDGVESFSIDGKDTWFRLPITVNEAVDKLFSHNETISLWKEIKEETSYHELVWNGMAWDIPDELKNCRFVKIFGTIPESIIQADNINIEIVLSKEAEAALEKMKGGK